MRIACAQVDPIFGDVQTNLDTAVESAVEAAKQGASVVVLPELATTGYVFESQEEAFGLAEEVPTGQTARKLELIVRKLGIHLVTGIAERDGERLYNTAAVFGPAGFVGKFRKVHLWDRENLVFHPGNLGFEAFDTPVGRLATFICYDGWFPESYRSCVLAGADIICIPTNWVRIPGQISDRPAMATYLCMANAHVNSVPVAAADRVGVERGQPFEGQSLIVAHTGWPIAGPASKDRPELLVADVDLAVGREARRWNAFNDPIRDRRPDVYLTASSRFTREVAR